MAKNINEIYIDGRTYGISATLDQDQYRVTVFHSENEFKNNLSNLDKGNLCFIIKEGELFLAEIVAVNGEEYAIPTNTGNYTYNKSQEFGKVWREFQVTNLINSKMSAISNLFDSILSTSESYAASLAGLAAGSVRIFPSLETVLTNYTSQEDEVMQEDWVTTTDEEGKTVEKLSAGTYIITLGRYQINDGGGATYYIANSTNNTKVDNVFIYDFNNTQNEGRVLVLLYDEYLHFSQLGGKANDSTFAANNTRILQSFITANNSRAKGNNLTLKFGSGTYFFNSTLLNEGNFVLEGSSTNTELESDSLNGKGTIIAYESNGSTTDTYLWCIGSKGKASSYFSNITLKNLTFSGGIKDSSNSGINFTNGTAKLPTLLNISRVQKSTFENLSFNGFTGAGLTIQSCYACNFDKLNFWHGFTFNTAALVFGSEIISDKDTFTSDLYFGHMAFKNIIDQLKARSQSAVIIRILMQPDVVHLDLGGIKL